jgi:hypothetical protein
MGVAMKAKPASCRIVASVPADRFEPNKGQMERTRPVSAFLKVARLWRGEQPHLFRRVKGGAK